MSKEMVEQLTDDEILNSFLSNAVEKAKRNIATKGRLETEDAIPLMLKSQFNHIAHLEKQMITRDEFNQRFSELDSKFDGKFDGLNSKFEGLKDQFSFTKWFIMLGFTVLGALQIYVGFIK